MWSHVYADLYVVLKGQCLSLVRDVQLLSLSGQCAGALYVGVLSFS